MLIFQLDLHFGLVHPYILIHCQLQLEGIYLFGVFKRILCLCLCIFPFVYCLLYERFQNFTRHPFLHKTCGFVHQNLERVCWKIFEYCLIQLVYMMIRDEFLVSGLHLKTQSNHVQLFIGPTVLVENRQALVFVGLSYYPFKLLDFLFNLIELLSFFSAEKVLFKLFKF